MQELAHKRIQLSLVHKLQSPLKDFVRQQITRLGPVTSLEELNQVKYFLGPKFLPEEQLHQLWRAWEVIKSPLTADLTGIISQLITGHQELLVCGDILVFDELSHQIKSLWHRYIQDSEAALELLKADYKKVSQLHLISAKTWSVSNQVVFHGIKFEYAGGILETMKIKGYTTQRYWADGKRRTDADSDYEDSFWMKGISTTRSLEFAANWAPVVLVLDLTKIKQQKEVVPYAWNFHMHGSTNFKKETEEFVVLDKTGRRFKMNENEKFMAEYHEGMKSDDPEVLAYYQKAILNHDHNSFIAPAGDLDISKIVMGVFLVGYIIDIYGIDHPVIQQVINHPLFIGILEK
jgi:hypothetical protein